MIEAPITTPLSSNRYPSHLLIQFMLVDYLSACSILDKISEKFKDPIAPANILLLKDKLLKLAEELTGCSSPHRSHFAWKNQGGVLAKLKNSSLLFQLSNDCPAKISYPIKKFSSKCWLYATEFRDIISHLSQGTLKFIREEMALLKKTESRIDKALKELGTAIIGAAIEFCDDENVLYCILDHQQDLDHVFGASFTASLFTEMHIEIELVRHLLCRAYKERGFLEFEHIIDSKMAALSAHQ